MKTALITGITGQDGAYLAKHLVGLGYRVIGLYRRTSTPNLWRLKRLRLLNRPELELVCGDVTDFSSLTSILHTYMPDEVYNLAAQSQVRVSFDQPLYTFDTTTGGCINLLEILKHLKQTRSAYNPKFYQASTSELYGTNYDVDPDNPSIKYQNEYTALDPASPYAVAKLAAHKMCQLYRKSYDMFICTGILFNHECLSSSVPIIYNKDNEIHIDFISDFFNKHVPGDKGVVPKGIKVWDKDGWVDINYASSFKHDTENDNKGLRIVNSRNSIYSVTNDHVCILEDDTESKSKDMNVGDRVKTVSYPNSENLYNLEEDFCEMLGMLVGDGHIKGNKGTFTNKNHSLRKRFEVLWNRYCGDTKFYPSKSGFTGDVVGRLDLRNANKIEDYELYTILKDVFGHRYKKVPYQVLNASVDCMEAFLVGYNSCDGLKTNPCQYRFKNFKTNSASLAAGLLFLVSKVTKQRYNLTIEESWEHGKQQFYYSINLLSDRLSAIEKYNKVKSLLDQNIPQRRIHRETGISRSFIRKIKNGYIPNNTHHLELCSNEIKKIIDIPNYEGWFFDLATSSGTFHAGVGQAVVHNSPLRGEEFVTRKITKWIGDFIKHVEFNVNDLSYNKNDINGFPYLYLGNLEAVRDWGHAEDYTFGMYLMMQHETPDDYVLATGEGRTIKEFVELAFKRANLDWEKCVKIDPKLYRPTEVDYLRGIANKASNTLGWSHKYTFKQLVHEMVDEDVAL